MVGFELGFFVFTFLVEMKDYISFRNKTFIEEKHLKKCYLTEKYFQYKIYWLPQSKSSIYYWVAFIESVLCIINESEMLSSSVMTSYSAKMQERIKWEVF